MSKLYRSSRNKMVTGLCGGLSEVFGIDATILRILVFISIPFSGGTTLFIYLVAALVIPKEGDPSNSYGNGHSNHGQVVIIITGIHTEITMRVWFRI